MTIRSLLLLSSLLTVPIAAQEPTALLQPIGRLPSSEVARLLQEVGDSSASASIRAALELHGQDIQFSQLKLVVPKPYQYTEHAYGFIGASQKETDGLLTIVDARNIQADLRLRNSRLRITLDRLRVFDYPGKGTHHVLLDFAAAHQTDNAQKQDLHFNQIYRVLEGAGAGVVGYPIFVGLRTGTDGIGFRLSTVNVENEDDRKFLTFLDTDVFKRGIELLNSLNPVIPVVTEFATGIATGVASRNKNVPVQDVYLGLDFDSNATRAKLCEGSYVVVQVPDPAKWNWNEWALNTASGQLVRKDQLDVGIPFNYVVFSISKM